MKHLLIITQYYPLPERPDIPCDNSVVRELCCAADENVHITVLLCHVYRRVEAARRFFRLMNEKLDANARLYRDGDVDVLLCEHPSVLPRVSTVYPCFAKKYASMVKQVMDAQGIVAFDAVAVHFPTRHTGLAGMIPAQSRTAVFHAFDVKSRFRLMKLPRMVRFYDRFTCRAPWIAKKVKYACPGTDVELCLSGLPAELLEDKRAHGPWMEDGVLHLAFAGKLNRNKNVETILRAMHSLAPSHIPVHLTVIGEGRELGRLKDLVVSLGIDSQVSFAGRKNRAEVFEVMKRSDVFVMISKSETLGLVYLEAMAAGALVVGASGQGADGLVTGGKTGFLVPWQDEKALADVLVKIASMKDEEAAVIRNKAYAVIRKMDAETMSRRYLSQALGETQVGTE